MAVIIICEKVAHGSYHPLAMEGEKVVECAFDEVWDHMDRCHFNLSILDCGFRVKKGLKLLKEIKAFHPGIPIIFITDISSEDIVLKAFKTGARDFFKKPLNIFELQKTIQGLLSARKESKEIRNPFKNDAYDYVEPRSKMSPAQSVNFSETICYIEENISNEITLEDIAKHANISKYHFCRLFKKRIGKSPFNFVRFMRIEKAKELLGRENLTISMAAMDVGFNDVGSFIKQFKKITGMTPSTYKRSFRGNDVIAVEQINTFS
jgi:YesN/AraC family two-component response regulator